MFYYRTNPIRVWLKELQISVEVETLNALQAKSVATTQQYFDAFLIRESQIKIQEIRNKSNKIIDGLDYFIDQIPIIYNDLKLIKTNFSQIHYEIHSLVRLCAKKYSLNCSPNKRKLFDSVLRDSEQTNKLIEFFSAKKNVNNSQLESTLRKLKQNFGQLINHTIKNECKVIRDAVYDRTGMLSLKWSLLSCSSLCENDAYICRLFIEIHKIVEPLIQIVSNYSSASMTEVQQIKAIALRVLTIFCINREAVKLLINESIYSRFLTNLIINESSDDLILKEGIDLMVQLTKPLIDSNDSIHSSADDFQFQLLINDFIDSLTQVIKCTNNEKIFLLSCAVFANISFVDIDSLIKNQVLNLILNSSVDSFNNISIRDQIITILANISSKYPLEIVKSGGLVYILKALHFSGEDLKNREELVTLERIQQKVSVAIARLSSNQNITQLLFRLNAVQRLIQLCKEPKERNFSDSVLIACVAALKRLAKTAQPLK